jgi:hypothetical protein
MGLEYVLKLLFCKKLSKLPITQQPRKVDKKISTHLESLEFLQYFLMQALLNLKTTKI